MRAFAGLEQVGAAARLFEGMETQRGEDFAHLLRQEAEVALQVFGLAGELRAQFGFLRRDADGAAV